LGIRILVDGDSDAILGEQLLELLVFDLAGSGVNGSSRDILEQIGSDLLALAAAVDFILPFLHFGLDFDLALLDCVSQAAPGFSQQEDQETENEAYGRQY